MDGAPSPDVRFLLAEVLGKLDLDLLAVELGHGLRALDRVYAVGPGTSEDDVHLLETPTLGLGEEEVDGRDQGRVDDGKDDVSSPSKVGESWRCDHDNDELEMC